MTLSPRQHTIKSAERWLSMECPENAAEDIHDAAVRIANIVLRLKLLGKTP